MFKWFKIDINTKLEDGQTLFHLATRYGEIEVMELLLSLGADIEAEYTGCWSTTSCCTPLMLAVGEGNLTVVKFLLSKGANVHARNSKNESVLHVDINHRTDDEHVELLKFLIDNGAVVNAKDDEDSTPLHNAARLENNTDVQLLVENEADVNILDTDSTSYCYKKWKFRNC
jgi:ankyrin repeat protein